MAGLTPRLYADNASPIVKDAKAFAKKVKDGWELYEHALSAGLSPTPYFFEAVDYARKAKKLQEFSLAGKKVPKIGDPLMEHIPIYNTVQRRYAGFSNVIEQLWYGKSAPKFDANKQRGFYNPKIPVWRRLSKTRPEEWLYLTLVHRITGSGASFEWDHGWRNNIVSQLAHDQNIEVMADELHQIGKARAIFTSIGNQIPPFNKPTGDWKTGGLEYLVRHAPELSARVFTVLSEMARIHEQPLGIKPAVDTVLEIQSHMGHRKFKFVLTAWVMDIAEYMPHLVDPNSDCYHGKNAIEAIEICFDKATSLKPMGQQGFYDAATRIFAESTGTHPMDVEDAAPGCDFVRWIENYVPKRGFDHVHSGEIYNGSSLVWSNGRQPLPWR